MTDLRDVFSPDVLDALDALVRERVAEALAAQPNGKPWLTIAEAASYVGVDRRTIERRIASGDLRAEYVGRRRIVARDSLDALLRSGGK